MSEKFTQEMVDQFLEDVNKRYKPSIMKKRKVTMIKVNGNFINIGSKTVWTGVGPAKQALNHCFNGYNTLGKMIAAIPDPDPREKRKNWLNFINFLEQKGIIEFVQVDSSIT